jgi:hypothetical protein
MNSPSQSVIVTTENVEAWPKLKKLLNDGKVRADSTGRLRYAHGAPVGAMIPVAVSDSGSPSYRESADEWFDPDSPKAESFV